MPRRAPRLDGNHLAVVDALRRSGASVQSLAGIGAGCPDLLVGWHGRNFLLELKDGTLPPSRQRLTPDEAWWHRTWEGQVSIARTIDEALEMVGRKVR